MADGSELKARAKAFFAAYDAHDIAGMTAFCSDDAEGRYAPYGHNNVVPIRGGIDAFWKGFTQAVPAFRVEVVEMLLAEGNVVVVQAIMSGPIPADPLGMVKDGTDVLIPHCYILRYDAAGKISHLDAYWDNAVLNGIKSSVL